MIALQDSFDVQTVVSDALIEDETFLEVLKVEKIGDEPDRLALSKKMNLQELKMELFNPALMPLVSIYFPEAYTSWNYLVSRGLLRIETYTTNRTDAKKLIKQIRLVLKEKLDMYTANESEQPCDIKNVYKYRLEYMPLISS